MKTAITLLFILLQYSLAPAQSMVFRGNFGKFNEASALDTDLNGNIYVSDRGENNITKLDSLGRILKTVGGYGWVEEAFDDPTDIFTNTLSVYVADKNNNRIQRFDKDLNFLSQFSSPINQISDVTFSYPTSVSISNQGDMYILDSDNNRILKFNLSGSFLLEIGSNDAGIYAVDNPMNFAIDQTGNIYVLDGEMIKIFDQFGNGIMKFNTDGPYRKISISENWLILLSPESIKLINLGNLASPKGWFSFSPINSDEIIVDAEIYKKILYLLTEQSILKYSFLKN